ncbi:MAG: aldehyde-activating protein [Hyphomicrobiales bacterium]|nr:MAG: aldehyde-activating protein [Hyphomicrobiales bacterium]
MSNTPPETLNAKCACGAVTATLRGPFRQPIACHCESCRRQSGHFTAATSVPRENFELGNSDKLIWWRATDHAERGFCADCGSLMFWKMDGVERVSIFMGCIDTPTGLQMEKHIYTEEKSDYYDI